MFGESFCRNLQKMGQHSPPWIVSTVALISLILLTSCTGLALDYAQQLIDIDVADSSHRHGGPRFLSTAATNLTALQMAARYRPPIINFKSNGGPVSSWIYNQLNLWLVLMDVLDSDQHLLSTKWQPLNSNEFMWNSSIKPQRCIASG